jgi:hypothetical protein
MEQSISGIFTVKSDLDGTRYEVTFKPEISELWSGQPDGFTVNFNNAERTMGLLGEHSQPILSQARERGVVQFHGRVSRDTYWRMCSQPTRATH